MKRSTEYSGTSWCIDLSGFGIINSDMIYCEKGRLKESQDCL